MKPINSDCTFMQAGMTEVELEFFRQLPHGQEILKSDFHPGIFTCPRLQMLWQRSNTTQTIDNIILGT